MYMKTTKIKEYDSVGRFRIYMYSKIKEYMQIVENNNRKTNISTVQERDFTMIIKKEWFTKKKLFNIRKKLL